jgi:flavin reductase (DIM6/NTAB) family NADH-FMN oxidoreductase RutF
MDLPWGDERTKQFVTNVGLITSNGSYGQNIMACEWTHLISYSPGLIAIAVGKNKTTNSNIRETKEFGISLASTDQSVIASISGGSTGKEVDKIGVLKELGFKFYKAKKIKALMVKDAVLNLECSLIKTLNIGSHTLFIGKAIEASANPNKKPLVYHNLQYWELNKSIEKPPQKKRDKISRLVERYRK